MLLGKISEEDGKMSYIYDQYVFHYIVEDKLIYLAMCDESSKRRIPFAFLDDVKQKFRATYGDKANKAIAFSMNEEFGKILRKQMEYFNGPSADTFAQVNHKLDDVKNVMVANIESILERGEKLELLVDKTEQLQQSSFQFMRSSRKLKNAMWWRRCQIYLLIFFVVALIIWIITAVVCGIDYSKCK